VLGGRGRRRRVKPYRRRNQKAYAGDRQQGPTGVRPRSGRDCKGDQSDSDDRDRQLYDEGIWSTPLGEAAYRADEGVITWSERPGDQHRDGRGRRSRDSKRAGQSSQGVAQLRV
jgi:hypothetical protein